MGKQAKNDWVLKCGKVLRNLTVARERFELSSEAPEASMLDHYTTGLHHDRFNIKSSV
jgi:hypothetical protein